MNMKKHFETATEPFEFTTLSKYGRKVVLEFKPNTEDNFSKGYVKPLGLFTSGMSVNSITKQGLMLYDYDLLSNKNTAKIKFENVELGNTLDV
jgi:hypothetical protein